MEINENKCTKCSLSNCKKCEGFLTNNTCISCLSSYNPKLLNKKVISCELDELKEINDSNYRYSDLSDEKIEESEKNENIIYKIMKHQLIFLIQPQILLNQKNFKHIIQKENPKRKQHSI